MNKAECVFIMNSHPANDFPRNKPILVAKELPSLLSNQTSIQIAAFYYIFFFVYEYIINTVDLRYKRREDNGLVKGRIFFLFLGYSESLAFKVCRNDDGIV